MRTARLLLLVIVVVVTTGCALIPRQLRGAGPAPTPTVGPVTPTSGGPVTPGAATYRMTGRALDDRNNAVSGVTVGLKLTTATSGCSSCGLYTATTGPDGTYTLTVPDGVYVGGCVAGSLTCRFAAAPSDDTVKVTIAGRDLTANLVITAGDSSQPSTGTDDSGTTVSGHVYTQSGRPVSGATVEFRKASCPDCMPQPFTTTDANGAYSLSLDPGVYTAECTADNCGVKGGGGGPTAVTVPPSRTVDFIVCKSPYNLAACLDG